MSSPTGPDPDPMSTTGLEPGGGVPPGETPPASGSTGGPQGHDEGGPPREVPWLVIAVIGLMALAVAGFFVARVIAWAS